MNSIEFEDMLEFVYKKGIAFGNLQTMMTQTELDFDAMVKERDQLAEKLNKKLGL